MSSSLSPLPDDDADASIQTESVVSTLGSQVEGAEVFGSARTPSDSSGTPRERKLSHTHTPDSVDIIASHFGSKSVINQRLKSFTEERLNFKKVSNLYGREEEIQKLQKFVYEEVLPLDGSGKQGKDRGLLLVEGGSGCGKSSLVSELRRIIQSRLGVYCKGKFDLRCAQPLFAIKTALTMLVDEIFKKPNTVYEQIKAKLSEELDSEIFLLARFLPDLLTLAGREASDEYESDHEGEGGKEAMDQFNFSVRKLMQIITSVLPVVLVCDDLQWSDPASLDILKTWLTDVETNSLIIVGIYRTETAIFTGDMFKMINEIKGCSEDRSIATETLWIGNLNELGLTEYLADLLRSENEDVESLSRVLMKKTGGNPFAVQQYLLALVKENLLTYNIGLTKWLWEEDAIRVSAVSENVADLMKARVQENRVACRILPIAACLGTKFSLASLEAIKDNQSRDTSFFFDSSRGSSQFSVCHDFINQSFGTELRNDLDECEEEGFILPHGDDNFTFVHDKIQEAALALIPDPDFVKFRLGEILWRSSNKRQLEDRLFEVIGLLKEKSELFSSEKRTSSKLELAQLFYAGGTKAQGIAAYRAAGDYYKLSVDLVSFETWKNELDFCLDLYSAAAESEYNGGRFEQMQVYASRVLSVECEMWKKLRVAYVLLQSYSATEDMNDRAVDFGIKTLAELGCKLPSSTSGAVYRTLTGLVSCKRFASKVTPEFLENLPVTSDPVHVGIMKMLDACVYPFYCRKPEYLPLLAIEMNRVTMTYGITPYAGYSFSFLGFIFIHFFGDLEAGKKYADYAFSLFRKYGFKEIEPKTIFMIYSTVWHWTNPLSNDVRVFLDIYEKGMKVGDCGTGLTSAFYYLEAALYTGRKLDLIDKDLVKYMEHTIDFKQEKITLFMELLLQCIRNLRGKSGTTTELTGTVVREGEKLAHYRDRKDLLMLSHVYKRKLFLCVIFGEFELGADLAKLEGDNMLKAQIGQTSVPVIAFNASLCCFAAARNSQKRQHVKQARKYRRMIKKWSQNNPNCIPYLHILDAEKAACLGKHNDATALYEKAIQYTGRSGLIPEQALANERLGTLRLEQNDIADARFRFEKAAELYSEWGSVAKMRKLKEFIDKNC